MAATFLILFLPFNSFQFGASFAQDSAILQIFISSFGSKQPTNRASLIIPFGVIYCSAHIQNIFVINLVFWKHL